jgi:hypothetical protein
MTTPFYEKARNLFLKTQDAQIHKGLQKYPEPFNPMSWTPQELLNHALEETVDLTHYLVGLKEQLDVKDDYIKQLEQELRYFKSENKTLTKVIEYKQATAAPYVYKPVTGDPLSPYGPYVARTDGKPPYFDPDDQ